MVIVIMIVMLMVMLMMVMSLRCRQRGQPVCEEERPCAREMRGEERSGGNKRRASESHLLRTQFAAHNACVSTERPRGRTLAIGTATEASLWTCCQPLLSL
ncbi:hypothetical protein BDZ88DRAFT_53589 [Geranomyces variabilis]|nr:hypothetical protein BDZ88DRAFT_53589 [Geranomyces variabilis]